MLDETDRRLLAYLKQDARAAVTTIASDLGLSRVTVQSRMARLVASGVISRFTVDITGEGMHDVVRAVMLIEVAGNMSGSVIRRLRHRTDIIELHTTNGAWDLVARIEAASLAEFDTSLREIREIQGISNSETCLLLNSAQP